MRSVLLAFALFSRIPVPRVEFRAENMRYLMAAFPLVGVVAGLGVIGWDWLCAALEIGAFLRGAGVALLPLALSGGIHMDGFCDTVDALASHGDVAKKQRILKDPNTGAFACVAAAGYILLFAACAAEGFGGGRAVWCFALAFVLSRCLAGLAVVLFPAAPESSLGRQFQDAAARRICVWILLLWAAGVFAGMVLLGGVAGAVAFVVPLGVFLWWRRVAAREFGGMSGDLSGWLLQVCELCSLLCVVMGGHV